MQLSDTQQEMIDFQNAGLFDTPIETAPTVSSSVASDWNFADLFQSVVDPLLTYKKAQLEAETRQKVAQYQYSGSQKLPTYNRTTINPNTGLPYPTTSGNYSSGGGMLDSAMPFLLIGAAGLVIYMFMKD